MTPQSSFCVKFERKVGTPGGRGGGNVGTGRTKLVSPKYNFRPRRNLRKVSFGFYWSLKLPKN